MLVKEHQFKLHLGNKPRSIVVEEYISYGQQWREKFRATVRLSGLESRVFYASTLEEAAEKAATYIRRIYARPIDQLSLHQVQLRQKNESAL
jgi:hypothetical protein